MIIASTGRAGSTMLFNAVARGFVDSRTNFLGRIFPEQSLSCISAFVPRLGNSRPGPPYVIKTHDYCPSEIRPGVRYIFVFGDPLTSILSAEQVVFDKGIEWFNSHQYNLRADGDFEDRYCQDVLNYEGQMVSWAASKRSDVLVVSYDDIWGRIKEIERFLGFSIVLPARRERRHGNPPRQYDKDLFTRLAKLAGDLYAKHRTY